MASDDEIYSEFRRQTGRSLRRMGWQILAVLIYIIASTAAYGFAIRNGWFARHGISEGVFAYMPLPVLFALMFLSGGKQNQPPRLENLPERILRAQIDHYEYRWRIVHAIFLAMLCITAIAAQWIVNTPAALVDKFVVIALFLLFAASCALGTSFRIGLAILDDERMQALRARSTKFGFIVLMAVLLCALPLTLQHPAWAAKILIWAIAAGSAAPSLYHIIADWRAEKEA